MDERTGNKRRAPVYSARTFLKFLFYIIIFGYEILGMNSPEWVPETKHPPFSTWVKGYCEFSANTGKALGT